MQPDTYEQHEQTDANQRMLNTDPRETPRASTPYMPMQPRRRSIGRTLAFCALAVAISIGIISLTGGVSFGSQQKVLPTRAFTINGHGQLLINDGSGTFHIHEGAGNQVIIQGSEYAYGLFSNLDAIEVHYAQQGNTVTLDASEGWTILGESKLVMDITVPANLDVNIRGGSTDADLTGISGHVTSNTSSGDIHLSNITGGLDLNSSSGDLTVEGEQGTISAHTSSGDIRLSQVTGPVDLSSSSGDITLDQAHISGQDQIQTTSGDIRFTGTLDPHGTYTLSTSSGDITLTLPANSSLQASISTSSGDVHNAFSTSGGAAPYAMLTLKTSSGDITLQK
ncbi:MAG TPA: DUF4097 family beta strand repeat-containing protein [Ktedonobacteraceae bacterium]|nr:DUF4097 family beta strand repeat-containing protein [Ktedonobacteraceae bacterium]